PRGAPPPPPRPRGGGQPPPLRVGDHLAAERAMPSARGGVGPGRQGVGRDDAVDGLAPDLVEHTPFVWRERLVVGRSPQPADRLARLDLLEAYDASRRQVEQRRRPAPRPP